MKPLISSTRALWSTGPPCPDRFETRRAFSWRPKPLAGWRLCMCVCDYFFRKQYQRTTNKHLRQKIYCNKRNILISSYYVKYVKLTFQNKKNKKHRQPRTSTWGSFLKTLKSPPSATSEAFVFEFEQGHVLAAVEWKAMQFRKTPGVGPQGVHLIVTSSLSFLKVDWRCFLYVFV